MQPVSAKKFVAMVNRHCLTSEILIRRYITYIYIYVLCMPSYRDVNLFPKIINFDAYIE
jgi:hypothetical protein